MNDKMVTIINTENNVVALSLPTISALLANLGEFCEYIWDTVRPLDSHGWYIGYELEYHGIRFRYLENCQYPDELTCEIPYDEFLRMYKMWWEDIRVTTLFEDELSDYRREA